MKHEEKRVSQYERKWRVGEGYDKERPCGRSRRNK